MFPETVCYTIAIFVQVGKTDNASLMVIFMSLFSPILSQFDLVAKVRTREPPAFNMSLDRLEASKVLGSTWQRQGRGENCFCIDSFFFFFK